MAFRESEKQLGLRGKGADEQNSADIQLRLNGCGHLIAAEWMWKKKSAVCEGGRFTRGRKIEQKRGNQRKNEHERA